MRLARYGAFVVGALLALQLLPACPRTAGVNEVYMSLDDDGARRRNVFYTDTKAITCVAKVASGRRDVTFQLRLRAIQLYDFAQKKVFDADRTLNYLEFPGSAQGGEQTLTATLKKTHVIAQDLDGGDQAAQAAEDAVPYDAGRFVCEVVMDGSVEASVVFNVLVAPCPDAVITPGTVCYKFVDKDAVCPAYGALSTESKTCRCDQDLGWDCSGK